MKVSAAALSFLILAATLGSPAHGSLAHESWDDELRMMIDQLKSRVHTQDRRPADCCPSYTPRKIQCRFMESYFLTTSGCSKPAVIFTTKRGRRVCANPNKADVENCVMNLNQDQALENLSRIHLSY